MIEGREKLNVRVFFSFYERRIELRKKQSLCNINDINLLIILYIKKIYQLCWKYTDEKYN